MELKKKELQIREKSLAAKEKENADKASQLSTQAANKKTAAISKAKHKADAIIDDCKILSDKIEIEFQSQSFLQQQVRSMVGCLKYVGEKKWTIKKFIFAMNSKERTMCAPPAPPEGLYLTRVIY